MCAPHRPVIGRAVPGREPDRAEHPHLALPVPGEQVDDAAAVVGAAGLPDPAGVVGALDDGEPVAEAALGLLQRGPGLPVDGLGRTSPYVVRSNGLWVTPCAWWAPRVGARARRAG